MGAPAGNEFWKLRSKHGRDKLYKTPELMWEAACEYFQWCIDNPWQKMEQSRASGKAGLRIEVKDNEVGDIQANNPNALIGLPIPRPFTLTGICLYLDCSASYFRSFKSTLEKKDKDFLTIINRIEDIIYTQKFEGAAVGAFNANIIARDLGLRESVNVQTDVNINHKKWVGKPKDAD